MTRLSISTLALLFGLALGQPALAAAADGVPETYQASYDLESTQDYAGALAKMDALVRAGHDDYVLHLRRGWLLCLLGRYADAVQAYGAAIDEAPESVEARAGLALPLMALRRWKEAETTCRELLRIAPGHYVGRSRLAYALYSAGRYGDAEGEYGALVRAYPSDVEMRAGMGWAALKQGDVTAARAAFREVLRTAPSHVSAAQGLEASR